MKALLVALLLAAVPAAAADTQRDRALAAGYKAAFLCSGIFNAGQTEAQVTADDLNGIYPEYQSLIAALPAKIDRTARTVSVTFDPALPPRIAAWRPLLGCASLPIGGTNTEVIPRLTPDFRKPDLAAVDAARWPLGDRGAAVRPPRAAAKALAAVVARAFDPAAFGGKNNDTSATTAVIILHNGKIVAERYRPGFDSHTPQRTWSVAKSLTAALIGRAAELGRIDIAAPAAIPTWSASGDPRAAITTEQLLRMNSGLWTAGPGNRTDAIYIGGATVPQAAATMPLEYAPGAHFNYSNNDIMLAALGLEARVADPLGFPFTELLWPLGMTRTTPETDWQGHFILSSQVWMTGRDLARLALLYSRDGIAPDGRRLLPAGWIARSTTPSGIQPPPGRGGYGLGIWLYGPADGLPAGTYGFIGNRGQFAIIVPARDLIIIRRGFDASGAAFNPLAFTKEVLNLPL
ncbi:6-aminohexanoate-dimer hydrolase [Polymorphobacter glacialis]|uniref:6-aminohexanoate-dimer hydrolase n=1 Tax=Sandarakinorhabdus glacialis TaxID=1614636 RepID=A0A916ZVS1_9SPHN|nr:serine hydrolase domain-containing protein [Polymorphobacter glacialis]GGE13871.1 6-aminohexanoate-dimer hydrolase [Polymorphobacter glacialis]